MQIDKFIGIYGLRRMEIKETDLRGCYIQQTPNREPLAFKTKEGDCNFKVGESPHAEMCSMYFRNGEKWLRKNYKSTRYYILMRQLGKKRFPSGIISLYDSVRKGYLREGHAEDYIVLLNKNFAISRYNRSDVNLLVPEVFSGHHRAGALCAMGRSVVKVLFAEDSYPGSCKSKGKIHGLCV